MREVLGKCTAHFLCTEQYATGLWDIIYVLAKPNFSASTSLSARSGKGRNVTLYQLSQLPIISYIKKMLFFFNVSSDFLMATV